MMSTTMTKRRPTTLMKTTSSAQANALAPPTRSTARWTNLAKFPLDAQTSDTRARTAQARSPRWLRPCRQQVVSNTTDEPTGRSHRRRRRRRSSTTSNPRERPDLAATATTLPIRSAYFSSTRRRRRQSPQMAPTSTTTLASRSAISQSTVT